MVTVDKEKRLRELTLAERETPERWHYFSFAGERFNGAAVVKCHGLLDGISVCHRLGINPGGEVIGVPIPSEALPPKRYRNRLLTAEDVKMIWPDAKTIAEHENAG